MFFDSKKLLLEMSYFSDKTIFIIVNDTLECYLAGNHVIMKFYMD